MVRPSLPDGAVADYSTIPLFITQISISTGDEFLSTSQGIHPLYRPVLSNGAATNDNAEDGFLRMISNPTGDTLPLVHHYMRKLTAWIVLSSAEAHHQVLKHFIHSIRERATRRLEGSGAVPRSPLSAFEGSIHSQSQPLPQVASHKGAKASPLRSDLNPELARHHKTISTFVAFLATLTLFSTLSPDMCLPIFS